MNKSLWIWGAWMLTLIFLYVFTSPYVPVALLLLSVLLPLLSIVFTWVFARKIQASIAVDELAGKGKPATGVLRVENKSICPFPFVVCKLHCHNLFTGERMVQTVSFSIGPKSSQEIPFTLTGDKSGRVWVSIAKIRGYDFFRLFGVGIVPKASGSVLVLPDTFTPDIVVSAGQQLDIECSEYSDQKPGFELSETFCLRDYVPGDALKSIHWKLTGKYDRLIVREAGLPVNKSVLILLERSHPQGERIFSPEVNDTLAEVAVSLSQSLADNGYVHSIGWQDAASGLFSISVIESLQDLPYVAAKMLEARIQKEDFSAAAHYLRQYGQCDFSNIIYISPYVAEDIKDLNPAGRFAMLICGEAEGESRVDDGTLSIIAFGPADYQQALSYIMI